MRNKLERGFDIYLPNLTKDSEIFEYQIDKTFFENFDQDILENGNLRVQAEVLKTHAMVTIHFIIDGTVDQVCDRSLEKFEEPLHINTSLFFKFGSEDEELDVNLYQIDYDTTTINLAKYLLECILVEIPFRSIHPKYRNDNSDSASEVYFKTDEDEQNEDPDPRWADLKKLKDRLN